MLRLQKISNRLGRHAANSARRRAEKSARPARRRFRGRARFCFAPRRWASSARWRTGLPDYFYLLAVKAVMDGLAMMSFVKMFRWPAALAAVAGFSFSDGLTLAVQLGAQPWLDAHRLTDSVNLAAGLVTCSVALVIFEVRRVELANYLPALAVAPLLALGSGLKNHLRFGRLAIIYNPWGTNGNLTAHQKQIRFIHHSLRFRHGADHGRVAVAVQPVRPGDLH